MSAKNPGRGILKISVLLVGVILVGAFGYTLFMKPPVSSIKDWEGTWEVNYFYENEPNLLYTGSLHIVNQDSLSGILEVFAPKSTNPEKLTLQSFTVSEDATHISVMVVHDQYKIRGGYMQELFDLILVESGKINGKGKCLEYCAEGTEDWGIILEGSRVADN